MAGDNLDNSPCCNTSTTVHAPSTNASANHTADLQAAQWRALFLDKSLGATNWCGTPPNCAQAQFHQLTQLGTSALHTVEIQWQHWCAGSHTSWGNFVTDPDVQADGRDEDEADSKPAGHVDKQAHCVWCAKQN